MAAILEIYVMLAMDAIIVENVILIIWCNIYIECNTCNVYNTNLYM